MTQTLDFNALFGFATTCHACGVTLDSENTHPISDERGWCVECAERQMARESIGLFFEALAQYAASCKPARTRKARMTDEEKQARAADKKAAAHAEKLASLVILGRATFKATGAILYGVQSGEKIYHLTMIDGVVRSCVDSATGESCKSRQYSGHCVHEERVMRYEAQRQSELAAAEQVAPIIVGADFASDLPAHIDDEIAGHPESKMVEEQPVLLLPLKQQRTRWGNDTKPFSLLA